MRPKGERARPGTDATVACAGTAGPAPASGGANDEDRVPVAQRDGDRLRPRPEESLAGVTHECDHPPSVRVLPKVSRTLIPHDATSAEIDALVRKRLKTQRALYTLDLLALQAVRPDLLVTKALCDVCAVAEAEVTGVGHQRGPAAMLLSLALRRAR
jgi:hypothetical protein